MFNYYIIFPYYYIISYLYYLQYIIIECLLHSMALLHNITNSTAHLPLYHYITISSVHYVIPAIIATSTGPLHHAAGQPIGNQVSRSKHD